MMSAFESFSRDMLINEHLNPDVAYLPIEVET